MAEVETSAIPDIRPLRRLRLSRPYSLGYVVAAACFLMWTLTAMQLPLQAYLRDLNIDDSFYYDVIARNFARGLWSTFDGADLTNGYHPLWAALLVPIYGLIPDPVTALRLAKVLEFALLLGAACGLLAAGRAAGWHWLAAFMVPLWLFGQPVLFDGMETAPQVLLLAIAALLLVRLFDDMERGSSWAGLALVCALLPWVRLELVVASVTLAACVTAYSLWRRQRHRPWIVLLWGAAAGSFAVYLAYNQLVFGTALPVSGQIKNFWSAWRIDGEADFSFFRNALAMLKTNDRATVAVLALLALVSASWRVRAYRDSRRSADHAIEAFIVTVAAAHLSRLGYSMVAIHAAYDSPWYYVPGEVAMAVAVPVLLGRLFLLWRLLRGRPALPLAELSAAAICLVAAGLLYPGPWELRARIAAQNAPPDWNMASYEGTLWMNRNLPADARIGSPDSGVVGYFSTHPVINLDGLVNSAGFFSAVRTHAVEPWMRAAGITYLAGGMENDVTDGCAYMARASVQPKPYEGPCHMVFEGPRYAAAFAGKPLDMRFRVFSFGPLAAQDAR